MRIILFLFCFLSFGTELSWAKKDSLSIDSIRIKKRMIRYNPLGTIVWKSVPLYYEHRLNKVVSFSMGGGMIIPHHIRSSNLSFQTEWFQTGFSDARITGYYFTPEFKFYLGGNAPQGFYVSRYLRYMKYNLSMIAVLDDENGNKARLDMQMTLSEYGTGTQLGYQWVLSENIMLDFFFLGWRASEYTFGFKAKADIESEQWNKLEEEFLAEYNAWIEDIPVGFLIQKLPFQISQNALRFSYPFAFWNVRHGISVGFRF